MNSQSHPILIELSEQLPETSITYKYIHGPESFSQIASQAKKEFLCLSDLETKLGNGLLGRAYLLQSGYEVWLKAMDEDEEENEKKNKYPSYRAEIPWSLQFRYSLTYSNSRNENDFSNNSLMFSGDIELTPKWKIGGSSGFDFKNHGFTYTQLRFNRDLDSWRLDFSWVPFSNRASWNFFIGIKSGLLSDIKYEKNREPDRKLR